MAETRGVDPAFGYCLQHTIRDPAYQGIGFEIEKLSKR